MDDYKAIEIGEMYLSHHGVKGQKWGIRHDRVAAGKAKIVKLKKKVQKIKIKRQKNILRLEKRRNKYDQFSKSRRGLIADKALIRQAKGTKNLGLLGRHYLTKKRKMEFKIAKLERKDSIYGKKLNRLDSRINKTKKQLNINVIHTDTFEDGEYLAHHGVKGMKWGIRHDPERVGRLKRAIAKVGNVTITGLKKAGKTSYKVGKTTYKAAKKASYNRTQRKIEKAIASGNTEKISKMFSKMNDQQTYRAINRINQRDAISRSRIEAGQRSLKNAKLQKRLTTLTLKNQIKQQKHPTTNRVKDNAVNTISNDLTKTLSKELTREVDYALLKKMHGSSSSKGVNNLKLTDDEIKKITGFQATKKALKSATVKSTKK